MLPRFQRRKPAKLEHSKEPGASALRITFQLQRMRNIADVNEYERRYLFAQMGLYARAISNEPIIAGKKMRAGKICSSCKCPLPAPHSPGLKRCVFFADKRLIFMYFRQCYGWRCCFRTEARKKLPKEFTFKTAATLRELARRGNCVTDRWDQEGFELGLQLGRGGIWLRLTDEQYAALGGVL